MRGWLDTATATNRRRLLCAVDAASGSARFDAAINAADLLIQRGDIPEIAAVGMLARRLADGTSPAAENVDLSVYDIFTADAFTTVNTATGGIV